MESEEVDKIGTLYIEENSRIVSEIINQYSYKSSIYPKIKEYIINFAFPLICNTCNSLKSFENNGKLFIIKCECKSESIKNLFELCFKNNAGYNKIMEEFTKLYSDVFKDYLNTLIINTWDEMITIDYCKNSISSINMNNKESQTEAKQIEINVDKIKENFNLYKVIINSWVKYLDKQISKSQNIPKEEISSIKTNLSIYKQNLYCYGLIFKYCYTLHNYIINQNENKIIPLIAQKIKSTLSYFTSIAFPILPKNPTKNHIYSILDSPCQYLFTQLNELNDNAQISFKEAFERIAYALRPIESISFIAERTYSHKVHRQENKITFITIVKNGDILICAEDGSMKILDKITLLCKQKIRAHNAKINDVIYIGNNEAYTCSDDKTVKKWIFDDDPSKFKLVRKLHPYFKEQNTFTFHSDSVIKLLLISKEANFFGDFYDDLIKKDKGNKEKIKKTYEDIYLIASLSLDNWIMVFDHFDESVGSMKGIDSTFISFEYLKLRNLIVSISEDKTLRFWDVEQFIDIQELEIKDVDCLNKDNFKIINENYLAIGGTDCISILDAMKLKICYKINGQKGINIFPGIFNFEYYDNFYILDKGLNVMQFKFVFGEACKTNNFDCICKGMNEKIIKFIVDEKNRFGNMVDSKDTMCHWMIFNNHIYLCLKRKIILYKINFKDTE